MRRNLISLAVCLAVVAAACGGGAEPAAQPMQPPPDIVEIPALAPTVPDDGRLRFIVTPRDPAPATQPLTAIHDDPWNLPAEVLETIPVGATLVFHGPDLGYWVDGEFVVVAGDVGRDAVGRATTYGHPVIDELAVSPSVERVLPLGDGTFSVVVTDPSVLDHPAIDVAADLPLALATDPLEVYQWARTNDGTSLLPLGLDPTPLQVFDADVDGEEANTAATGAGVVVAVVDSGIDFGHPDLAAAAWTNPGETCGNGLDDDNNGYVDDCTGWDFGSDDNEPYAPSNHPHGTHVAGIIAAADNGIGVVGLAPDVRLMDLNVTTTSTGNSIMSSSIALAIRYAVDNGADVVNLSLGTAPGLPIEAVSVLVSAAEYAEENGVLLVAAAGNDAVDLTTAPVYPASIDLPNVLVVGASTPGDTIASFSNRGSTVDLFAPGDYLLSTLPGADHAFMSGTSQAAPVVAAIAALVLEGNAGLAPPSVVAQIIGTSDERPALAVAGSPARRVNAARSVGLAPDAGMDNRNAHVVIRGLDDATLDGVRAELEFTVPGGQFNQAFSWEASFVALVDGGVYGLVDHPIDIDGTPHSSNERGAVVVADDDATSAVLETILPAGSYGLVIEAVPRTDPTVRLGQAFIATFGIGDPTPPPTPTPTDDPEAPADPEEPGAPTDPPGGAESPDVGEPSPTPAPDNDQENGDEVPTPPAVDDTDPPTEDGDDADTADEVDPPDGDTDPTADIDPEPEPESDTEGDAGTDTEVELPVEPPADTPPLQEPPADDAPTSDDDTDDLEWDITSITPRAGPVMTETVVFITGTLPVDAEFWFGEQAGFTVFRTQELAVVRTPLAVEPGVVDVSVVTTVDGTVLIVPSGFEFLAEGGTAPGDPEPIDPIAPPTEGPDDPAPVSPTTTVPSVEQPGATDPTDDSAPEDAPGEPEDPSDPADDVIVIDPADEIEVPDVPIDQSEPTTQRQARADVIGEPVDLGNGLTGVPLDGLSAFGGVPACDSDPCRTRRIGG